MVVDLTEKSKWVRQQIIEMCAISHTGHVASALSCVDIIVALYYGDILKYDSKNSQWNERDRFILSKGHGCMALYPVLADLGFFPKAELEKFCSEGGILGSHPSRSINGIEINSGSLGHGLGIGCGMATAAKMDNKDYKTVVLLGDGELYEGSVWEAIMFAGHHKLDNLIAIVDRNRLSCNDFTEDYLGLEPLMAKWRAFDWVAGIVNGHSPISIQNAIRYCQDDKGCPHVIICNTIKGKGVSFMEDKPIWHVKEMNNEDLDLARQELCN
jgi:transketolase